jgi:hypothetical protein
MSANNVFKTLDDLNYHYGTRTILPVAEQNQTYFAYFDGIGNPGAEMIGQTAYYIKYIIDVKGNVVNPEPKTEGGSRAEAIGLYNLLNNFELGKKATVKLIEPDPTKENISTEKDILGTYTITGVGTVRTIMTTEKGYFPNDYITTMSFYNPNNPNDQIADLPTFWAYYEFDDNYVLFNNTETSASYVEPWPNAVYGFGSSSINDGPIVPPKPYPYKIITPLTSSVEAGTRVQFVFDLFLSQDKTGGGLYPGGTSLTTNAVDNAIKFRLRKNGVQMWSSTTISDITAKTLLSTTSSPIIKTNRYIFYTNFFNVDENDDFVLTYDLVHNASGSTSFHSPIIIASGSGIYVNPEYRKKDLVPGFNIAYSPYFQKIENYPAYSRLYFNDQLEDIYGATPFAQNINDEQLEFGFSQPKIPFNNIQTGDNIRFEYNPNMYYKIIGVGASAFSDDPSNINKLYIDVAPSLFPTPSGSDITAITSSIITNHFSIYRIENDGRSVILNVPNTSDGTAYSGILQSEYSSQELVNNFDKLILDLSQKEIIQ